MSRIQEEFEKWWNNEYSPDEQKIRFEIMKPNLLRGFEAGYKSRDAEIKNLKQIQIDSTVVIMNQEAEINKLRKALAEAKVLSNYYGKRLVIYGDEGITFYATELLKDGD